MLTTLAGCATSASRLVRPEIPALPGSLATACRDPGVTAGRTALAELARQRQALAECRRKHRDTVAFYDDLRRRLGGR